MINKLPLLLLSLALLASLAGIGCLSEPPTPGASAPIQWENPDNLVMEGRWTGTYDVGFHRGLFVNDLTMYWSEGTYRIEVTREERLPEHGFHATTFTGEGSLFPGQRRFWAAYSPQEYWLFEGSFSQEGGRMIFRGNIRVDAEVVGSFKLTRERQPLPEPQITAFLR